MVYVVRLASGDSIITFAGNEKDAHEAACRRGLEAGDEVISVRRLPQFCLRLTPADSGTLEIDSWDDATLDDILTHEYPQFDAAIRAANRVKFLPSPDPNRPIFEQLRQAYDKNTEIIREGIRQERPRERDSELDSKHDQQRPAAVPLQAHKMSGR